MPMEGSGQSIGGGHVGRAGGCCGLPPLAAARIPPTQRSAAALQWLLAERRAEGRSGDAGGSQLRCFDDGVIERLDPETGAAVSLTECRCTLSRRLRALAGITEDEYFASVCASPWVVGGRGGEPPAASTRAASWRSSDGRLVVEIVGRQEIDTLRHMMPHLVLYFEQNARSLLCRYLGAYTLCRGGSQVHFVVMSSVLTEPAQQVFGLKGTSEDGWLEPATTVLAKDLRCRSEKVFVAPGDRQRLVEMARDDAEFLGAMHVADYSMLVGLRPASCSSASSSGGEVRCWVPSCEDRREACDMQLGIVDYLRCRTPKQAVAQWFSRFSIGCCFREVDVEPSAVYCRRFCKNIVEKLVSFR